MSTADNYLHDLLPLLISRAQEAAQQARSSQGTDEHLFHEGRALAYYEVISTLIGQGEVFGVEVVSELGCEPGSLLGQVGQMPIGASGLLQDAIGVLQTS